MEPSWNQPIPQPQETPGKNCLPVPGAKKVRIFALSPGICPRETLPWVMFKGTPWSIVPREKAKATQIFPQ